MAELEALKDNFEEDATTQLAGKTALMTGGNRGIGAAVAIA